MKLQDKILNKINETSLAKICFFNKPFEELIESLDFYNVIFAGNGMYIALKNDFAISIDKVPGVKYSNSELENFFSESSIYSFIPKPNISLFVKIIEIFKYVYDKIKSEVLVNVYFNKLHNKFHISICDQTVADAKTKYTYDEKFEMSKDYIRYLQIHSHHTMGANFSPKDNYDENMTAPCYYGVVGKLDSKSSFYNVDSKFRFWNGMRFVEISFDSIFDVGLSPQNLSKDEVSRLESIINISKIENSKEIKNKALQSFPGFNENTLAEILNSCNVESDRQEAFNELSGIL